MTKKPDLVRLRIEGTDILLATSDKGFGPRRPCREVEPADNLISLLRLNIALCDADLASCDLDLHAAIHRRRALLARKLGELLYGAPAVTTADADAAEITCVFNVVVGFPDGTVVRPTIMIRQDRATGRIDGQVLAVEAVRPAVRPDEPYCAGASTAKMRDAYLRALREPRAPQADLEIEDPVQTLPDPAPPAHDLGAETLAALEAEVERAIADGTPFHTFKGRVEALFRKAGSVQ